MEEQSVKKKNLTPLQARRKAENYCVYQERSQQEMRDKLYSWGLHSNDVENIISDLISENFLNEERFAKAFASGKFRLMGWGKIKISQHLKAKRVTPTLIKIALKEIDLDEYENRLQQIIEKKIRKGISDLSYSEKSKLIRYLQSKGYESDLIYRKIDPNEC